MINMNYSTIHEFSAPTKLVFGQGAIERVPSLLQQANVSFPLVVTDQGIREAGLLRILELVFEGADISHTVFDETEPNPSAETVKSCTQQYREGGCDCIIGLGGGSAMDVAKGTGVMVNNSREILSYEGMDQFKNPPPYLLCIPTNYGTGSEVTPFAVITDTQRRFKVTIGGEALFPNTAILDPNLSVRLPIPVAAATGMDALTHAIEAFVCLAGNPITRSLAIQAVGLISNNLRQAALSNQNIEATGNMLIAATLAGRSFGFTRLGTVHAMAHPLGAHFDVPHGVANAVLLPHVMKFNLPACPAKYAEIARALGESDCLTDNLDMGSRAIDLVISLSQDLCIPKNLKILGVRREGFQSMAIDAMKSGNIPVNPRETSHQDIYQLFEQAFF